MMNTLAHSPGSLTIMNEVAEFMNVFLGSSNLLNILINSNVYNPEIHDVVVAIAGTI